MRASSAVSSLALLGLVSAPAAQGPTFAAAANWPAARYAHAMAYDEGRARTVLFGGVDAGGGMFAFVAHLRAMQLAPGDLIPNHNVAAAALELGLVELAIEPAVRARDLDRTGSHGPRVYAEALLAQPEVDAAAALAAAREADARAKGRNLRARVVLAKATAASGDRSQAVALLEAAAQDPGFQQSSDRHFLEQTLAWLQGAR